MIRWEDHEQFVFFLLLISPGLLQYLLACLVSLKLLWKRFRVLCFFFFFLQVFNENYVNQQAGTPELGASRPLTNKTREHFI